MPPEHAARWRRCGWGCRRAAPGTRRGIASARRPPAAGHGPQSCRGPRGPAPRRHGRVEEPDLVGLVAHREPAHAQLQAGASPAAHDPRLAAGVHVRRDRVAAPRRPPGRERARTRSRRRSTPERRRRSGRGSPQIAPRDVRGPSRRAGGRLSMSRALPPSWRRALLFGSAAVCMAAAPPAAQAHEQQQGKVLTRARFLHAVPMAAPATLIVHGHPPRIHSSYGHPSAYHDCHPGPARVELKAGGPGQAGGDREHRDRPRPLHGDSGARGEQGRPARLQGRQRRAGQGQDAHHQRRGRARPSRDARGRAAALPDTSRPGDPVRVGPAGAPRPVPSPGPAARAGRSCRSRAYRSWRAAPRPRSWWAAAARPRTCSSSPTRRPAPAWRRPPASSAMSGTATPGCSWPWRRSRPACSAGARTCSPPAGGRACPCRRCPRRSWPRRLGRAVQPSSRRAHRRPRPRAEGGWPLAADALLAARALGRLLVDACLRRRG